MPAHKIYDSPHQQNTIYHWIKRGLLLREGETYKEIYSFYMDSDFCNQCNIKFNDAVHNEKKTMDHDHSSGYFRQVLCMKCNKGCDRQLQENTKTGHQWISPTISKRKSGKIHFYFRYKRAGFKIKTSISLTKMIAYSFIQLLKSPAIK